MNAYLVTAVSGDNKQATWAASQTEAAGARKAFTADGFKRAEMETHSVNIPTSKHELIEFLNLLSAGPDIVAASQRVLGK